MSVSVVEIMGGGGSNGGSFFGLGNWLGFLFGCTERDKSTIGGGEGYSPGLHLSSAGKKILLALEQGKGLSSAPFPTHAVSSLPPSSRASSPTLLSPRRTGVNMPALPLGRLPPRYNLGCGSVPRTPPPPGVARGAGGTAGSGATNIPGQQPANSPSLIPPDLEDIFASRSQRASKESSVCATGGNTSTMPVTPHLHTQDGPSASKHEEFRINEQDLDSSFGGGPNPGDLMELEHSYYTTTLDRVAELEQANFLLRQQVSELMEQMQLAQQGEPGVGGRGASVSTKGAIGVNSNVEGEQTELQDAEDGERYDVEPEVVEQRPQKVLRNSRGLACKQQSIRPAEGTKLLMAKTNTVEDEKTRTISRRAGPAPKQSTRNTQHGHCPRQHRKKKIGRHSIPRESVRRPNTSLTLCTCTCKKQKQKVEHFL
ncbi:unnamed protein product [Amoebophrya sp. A120]|nr:unnamed protein product [Amoebophrya sp. A120]|eukprot:GSA120T00006654001.1